jgi:hypothetical protein
MQKGQFYKPTLSQLVKKIRAFYGTWNFVVIFATAR